MDQLWLLLCPVSSWFPFPCLVFPVSSAQKCPECHFHLTKCDLNLLPGVCLVSPGPPPLSEIGWKDSRESAQRCTYREEVGGQWCREEMGLDHRQRRHSVWRSHVVVFSCSLHPVGCPLCPGRRCHSMCAMFPAQGGTLESRLRPGHAGTLCLAGRNSRLPEGRKVCSIKRIGRTVNLSVDCCLRPGFQTPATGQELKQVLPKIAGSGLLW